MTRLVEDWIRDILSGIKEYEKDLIDKTGLDYTALASAASGIPVEKLAMACENVKVAVVPITTGLGIIGSFSESVAAIVRCMHFEAFVTEGTDVDGIYEASCKGAGIIFMADDNRFIALNPVKNIIAENSYATALGFAAALEAAAEGLKGKKVLVIGCGVVGRYVLDALRQKGALPVAYDREPATLRTLGEVGFETINSAAAIAEYKYIIDASSSGGWLKKGMLHPEAWFVTPGVPLSLDEEAYSLYKDRVIHDYLPIGVATMLAIACK